MIVTAVPDDAVTISAMNTVELSDGWKVEGGQLFLPMDASIETKPIIRVDVEDKESSVSVTAIGTGLVPVPVETVRPKELYLIAGEGDILVQVTRYNKRTGDIYTSMERVTIGNQPVPPLDPTDPNAPPAGISREVAKWAAEVGDPVGSQKYALVFEVARDALKDEKLNFTNVFAVLFTSADAIIDPQWQPFREKLGDYFSSHLEDGTKPTQTQLINDMELIRYGLEYSARGSDTIDMADSVKVIGVVNGIINGINK